MDSLRDKRVTRHGAAQGNRAYRGPCILRPPRAVTMARRKRAWQGEPARPIPCQVWRVPEKKFSPQVLQKK